MNNIVNIFKAFSDETRLRILKLIEGKEVCVCAIVGALGISQPNVSFHLNILKEAGLVTVRKAGRMIYYRIDDSDLFRRFLMLSALERIPEEETLDDRARLGRFLHDNPSMTVILNMDDRDSCCQKAS